MDQHCFVLDLVHPKHGRIKQVRLSKKLLAYSLLSLMALAILGFALSFYYVRMSWQVYHYNELRANFDGLRNRYQELLRISRQHGEQMASLENFANEISVAYGIPGSGQPGLGGTFVPGKSLPTNSKEPVSDYNFLKSAGYSAIYQQYAFRWQSHARPSLWPVEGVLRSAFGGRSDPFSGEGAFHTGIDLSVPKGTPVHVTADGVVASAGWAGAYGKLVIVDHGNGIQTYYAHLSAISVVPGQEVGRNQTIALSGETGRATGPHIHYEVRLGGTPVNPYRYLAKAKTTTEAVRPVNSDLGL